MASYLQELVSNSGEPAFAVDDSGRITAWNDAAAEAFGFDRGDAVGRDCWRVLDGRDVFGNRYCGPSCPHREMAARCEPIKRCRMKFGLSGRHYAEFIVSNLATHLPSGRFELLHLCRPAEMPLASVRRPAQASDMSMVTPREKEVLAELAEGHSTRQIAAALNISVPTVRNHIDHILAKLNCHSRLQAVAEARKFHLT